MEYETVIGLEVHVQLLTKSKMYCRCSADYASALPNTHVCPVCLGMPGVLPNINRQALEYALMTALSMSCTIPEFSRFDRKNYPYPDLMKGYQISQYDNPLSHHGYLEIEFDGISKHIEITRVHLEEDVAKLTHNNDPGGEAYSLVDVNRAGVPLMEIVSEPDLRSAKEARQYLMTLRSILRYLEVSTGNMEEGSFRCDANISIRPVGSNEFLSKVEVKNMNSFKAVYRALQYEEERQRKVIGNGGKLEQETRGWVEEEGVTVTQRSKEYAHDYRYFPEPDLPPIAISRSWVDEIKSRLPELPDAKRKRFSSQYGLSSYDAELLTTSRALADYFENCLTVSFQGTMESRAKKVANWLLGEFARLLNAANIEITESKVKPQQLVELLGLVDENTLSLTLAKTVFEEMFSSGKPAPQIISESGLAQISSDTELEPIANKVLAANTQAISDFKQGKEQALTFLMGQVMKATRGQANPKLVSQLLRKKLEES
ncbi:Asp-tRNA(Asn)/Glu-tRNA(Gln) amidotransferase subunit GatB [Chloroflexota bacterium]